MSKNKKSFKSFTATSEKMEAAMEALVKSNNYIVITQTNVEHQGKIGIMNGIDHDAGSLENTVNLLTAWADEMQHQKQHQDELKDLLGESGINNS